MQYYKYYIEVSIVFFYNCILQYSITLFNVITIMITTQNYLRGCKNGLHFMRYTDTYFGVNCDRFFDKFHEIHPGKHFGSLFKSIVIPSGSWMIM